MMTDAEHLAHCATLVELGTRLGDAEDDLERFTDDGHPADGAALIRNLKGVADSLDGLIQDLQDVVFDQRGQQHR